MDTTKLYMKQNIQVEPLINQWYAWIHLVPPATAALNIVNRHLTLMTSYVNSPMMHAAAVKNPEMRGGPFIDLDGKRVAEVKALLQETKAKSQLLQEFAKGVKELNQLLKSKAKGFSMEALYGEVPEILRGYVELCYDMNHNPSFRFFEALLYKSPFYRPDFQGIALSPIVTDGDRPFILSTPRLEDANVLHLPIPFAHPGVDELFKMKKVPQTFDYILDKMGEAITDESLFRSFFTEEAPPAYEKYEGDSIRIRYFGHACILVETKEVSLLIDPVLSYTYESDISRYTYQDLPDTIDYVLITHGHQDHILLETMLQIRHKVKNIIIPRNADGYLPDPSLQLALQQLGFKNTIIELRDLQEVPIPGGKITGIPFLGEHHDLAVQSKTCYLIELDGRTILSVADSCNQEPKLYEKVYEVIGDVDVLFLGMECDGAPASWVYGPLFPEPLEREADRSRRGRGCNYKEGMDLLDRFHCKEVYVYAMGNEPWLRYMLDVVYTDESNPIVQSNKLLKECQTKGVMAERLFGEKELMVGVQLAVNS
ncbi:MAG: MBL fold metallo-hydrolase [Bacteroidota bacterium]